MNPLFNYLLKLADDTLIFGQRLGELCGQGPYLEEDIALTNIALDYLGQSSNFYKYAAQIQNEGKTEDDLAFLRLEKEYLNCQLSELPNGDYANTILKVYFFSLYQKIAYEALMESSDEQISAIAEKSLKEVKYHYTHTSTWVKMFAGGTEESKTRLKNAVELIRYGRGSRIRTCDLLLPRQIIFIIYSFQQVSSSLTYVLLLLYICKLFIKVRLIEYH